MTSQHPITPPAELVQEWINKWNAIPMFADSISLPTYIAACAAQWGADMELKACCEWLGAGKRENLSQVVALRAARRPKPPNSKEQALRELRAFAADLKRNGLGFGADIIRRALEQLDD
jgi:hypothetical protein